jgi:hypothetical protein
MPHAYLISCDVLLTFLVAQQHQSRVFSLGKMAKTQELTGLQSVLGALLMTAIGLGSVVIHLLAVRFIFVW